MDDDLRPVSSNDLVFDIELALSKAAGLWPRRRAWGNNHPYRLVAREVVAHLALCRIRCFRKQPEPWHSIPSTGLRED